MKNFKKLMSMFMLTGGCTIIGLTALPQESQAACQTNKGFEDWFCSETGCSDVGFDACGDPKNNLN